MQGENFLILGDTLRTSFWSFGASGFQFDYWDATVFGVIEKANSTSLKSLKAGDVVDGNASYGNMAPASNYYPALTGSATVIADGQSTYFGFRINKGANMKYYGWLKLTRISESVVTIDSIGYDDEANKPIKAGQASASTTSVGNVTASEFAIYPNPVKNVMTVTTPNNMSVKEVSIFNLSGQLVMQQENSSGGAIVSISLDHLTNGSYFLQIRSREGKLENHQFIKE